MQGELTHIWVYKYTHTRLSQWILQCKFAGYALKNREQGFFAKTLNTVRWFLLLLN